VGVGGKKIRKIKKIIGRLGWGGERKFNQNKKVGSRLSKGEKSEPMLTSLVNTWMKKWNHPLVHHSSGLVHWWVLVHSGWYRKGFPCTELPHLLCQFQINGMAEGHYTLDLRVSLHSKGVMPCCQGFPLQQHIGIYGTSFIKWQIILCFILFYFILLYCIFTPGGLSSKKLVHNVWVQTSQYKMQLNTKFWIELKKGKTDLKSLPQTVWSLESEVWILSHTIAKHRNKVYRWERERERESYRTLWVM